MQTEGGGRETRRHGDTETRRHMDTPRQDLLKLFSLCRVLLAQSNGPTTQRNPDVALLLPPPATVLHEQGGFAEQESTKSMVRCTNPRQHTSLCSLGRRSMRQTVASPLDACWPARGKTRNGCCICHLCGQVALWVKKALFVCFGVWCWVEPSCFSTSRPRVVGEGSDNLEMHLFKCSFNVPP